MAIELRLLRYFAVVAEELDVCFPRAWAPSLHDVLVGEPPAAEPESSVLPDRARPPVS